MPGEDDTADLKIMPTEELKKLLHVDDEPAETDQCQITDKFRSLDTEDDRSPETIVLEEMLDLMDTTEFQRYVKSTDTDSDD